MVFAKGAVGRRPRGSLLRGLTVGFAHAPKSCVGAGRADVGIGPYEGMARSARKARRRGEGTPPYGCMARSSVKQAAGDAGPYGVHGKGFGIWGITDCHDQ